VNHRQTPRDIGSRSGLRYAYVHAIRVPRFVRATQSSPALLYRVARGWRDLSLVSERHVCSVSDHTHLFVDVDVFLHSHVRSCAVMMAICRMPCASMCEHSRILRRGDIWDSVWVLAGPAFFFSSKGFFVCLIISTGTRIQPIDEADRRMDGVARPGFASLK